MSAVVRLVRNGSPEVLLAGDTERACLDFWREEKTNPAAKILVFPHHGGRPGSGNPVEFATELCRMVQPEVVLFSIHRSLHRLPIPDVVRAVRGTLARVRVACTQLSTHCAKTLPAATAAHLQDVPSHGRETGSCCAGSVVIDLTGPGLSIRPIAEEHVEFIRRSAESPLCL